MALIKQPHKRIHTVIGEQAEQETLDLYERKIEAWDRWRELAQFFIQKAIAGEKLPFGDSFDSTFEAGPGLALIYKSPYPIVRPLPYERANYTQQPEPSSLDPGYVLALERAEVHTSTANKKPVSIIGEIDGDIVVVRFDDFRQVGHYVSLDRDPSPVGTVVPVLTA